MQRVRYMIILCLYVARCNILRERNKGTSRRQLKLERDRCVLLLILLNYGAIYSPQ